MPIKYLAYLRSINRKQTPALSTGSLILIPTIISIVPSSVSLVSGSQQQLVAITYTQLGTIVTGSLYSFTSSNSPAFSVNSSGLVTAFHTGSGFITVNDVSYNLTANVSVLINNPLVSINTTGVNVITHIGATSVAISSGVTKINSIGINAITHIATPSVIISPYITSIIPSSGSQGSVALSFNITGNYILSDAITVLTGLTGVSVTDSTVINSTSMTGHITINSSASIVTGNIKLYSPTSGYSNTLSFSVTAAGTNTFNTSSGAYIMNSNGATPFWFDDASMYPDDITWRTNAISKHGNGTGVSSSAITQLPNNYGTNDNWLWSDSTADGNGSYGNPACKFDDGRFIDLIRLQKGKVFTNGTFDCFVSTIPGTNRGASDPTAILRHTISSGSGPQRMIHARRIAYDVGFTGIGDADGTTIYPPDTQDALDYNSTQGSGWKSGPLNQFNSTRVGGYCSNWSHASPYDTGAFSQDFQSVLGGGVYETNICSTSGQGNPRIANAGDLFDVFTDGCVYDHVVVFDQWISGSARYVSIVQYYKKYGTTTWLQLGTRMTGQVTSTTLERFNVLSPYNENYNMSRKTDLHWYIISSAAWDMDVDGSHADPLSSVAAISSYAPYPSQAVSLVSQTQNSVLCSIQVSVKAGAYRAKVDGSFISGQDVMVPRELGEGVFDNNFWAAPVFISGSVTSLSLGPHSLQWFGVSKDGTNVETTGSSVLNFTLTQAPGTPTVSDAIGVTQTSLSIPFTIANDGTVVNSFSVRYSMNGGSTWVSSSNLLVGAMVSGSSDVIAVKGLPSSSQAYSVQFASKNTAGNSGWSNSSNGITANTGSAITYGIDFRDVATGYTDPTNCYAVVGGNNVRPNPYPQNIGGRNVGWRSNFSSGDNTRTRDNGQDIRLKGLVFEANNGTRPEFEIDVDNGKRYDVLIGACDDTYGADNYITVMDDTIPLFTCNAAPPAGHASDAWGNVLTDAQWVASSSARNVYCASGKLVIKIGSSTNLNENISSVLSHVFVIETLPSTNVTLVNVSLTGVNAITNLGIVSASVSSSGYAVANINLIGIAAVTSIGIVSINVTGMAWQSTTPLTTAIVSDWPNRDYATIANFKANSLNRYASISNTSAASFDSTTYGGYALLADDRTIGNLNTKLIIPSSSTRTDIVYHVRRSAPARNTTELVPNIAYTGYPTQDNGSWCAICGLSFDTASYGQPEYPYGSPYVPIGGILLTIESNGGVARYRLVASISNTFNTVLSDSTSQAGVSGPLIGDEFFGTGLTDYFIRAYLVGKTLNCEAYYSPVGSTPNKIGATLQLTMLVTSSTPPMPKYGINNIQELYQITPAVSKLAFHQIIDNVVNPNTALNFPSAITASTGIGEHGISISRRTVDIQQYSSDAAFKAVDGSRYNISSTTYGSLITSSDAAHDNLKYFRMFQPLNTQLASSGIHDDMFIKHASEMWTKESWLFSPGWTNYGAGITTAELIQNVTGSAVTQIISMSLDPARIGDFSTTYLNSGLIGYGTANVENYGNATYNASSITLTGTFTKNHSIGDIISLAAGPGYKIMQAGVVTNGVQGIARLELVGNTMESYVSTNNHWDLSLPRLSDIGITGTTCDGDTLFRDVSMISGSPTDIVTTIPGNSLNASGFPGTRAGQNRELWFRQRLKVWYDSDYARFRGRIEQYLGYSGSTPYRFQFGEAWLTPDVTSVYINSQHYGENFNEHTMASQSLDRWDQECCDPNVASVGPDPYGVVAALGLVTCSAATIGSPTASLTSIIYPLTSPSSGATVLGVILEYFSASCWTPFATPIAWTGGVGSTQFITVSPLSSSTNYSGSIRFRLVSNYGMGVPVIVSSGTTTSPVNAPNNPTVSLFASSSISLTYAITAASSGTAPASVTAEVDENGTNSWVTQSANTWTAGLGGTQDVIVTGLTSAKDYSGKIRFYLSTTGGDSSHISASSGATIAATGLPVTSGLILLLDANVGTNTTTNSGSISLWQDQSPTGLSFIPVSSSNQPMYILSAFSGSPAIHFDTNKYLVAGKYSSAFSSAQFSAAIVWKMYASSTTAIFAIDNRGTSGSATTGWGIDQEAGVNADGPRFEVGAGATRYGVSLGNRDANPHVNIGTQNSSIAFGYQDGAAIDDDGGIGLQNTNASLVIGGSSLILGTGTGKIDIAYIAVWNRALSSTEVTNVNAYLKSRYGTP